MPPISQLTIRHSNDASGYGSDGGESMGSSASEITYGTRTSHTDHTGSSNSGPHCVTRMPFTDAYGDKGWYTGEVASGSGLPHGQGQMHYCDGGMSAGYWSNGILAKSGPLAPNPRPPPMPLNQQHSLPPKGGKSKHRSSGSHSSQNSNNHRAPTTLNTVPPPKQQQQQYQAPAGESVFNVEWRDHEGALGYYTGETDESGEPNGLGSMCYLHDNSVIEGEWYHGKLEQRLTLNLQRNMTSHQ